MLHHLADAHTIRKLRMSQEDGNNGSQISSLHVKFFMLLFLLSSADFQLFSTTSFRNTISVSNGLDPDQDRRSVGPDMGPNCLQRFKADDTSRR